MNRSADLKPGHVVQLSPTTIQNKAFAGCMLTVTEINQWGVQGYVQALGERRDVPGGLAFYRAEWDEFEFVGVAPWVQESATESEVSHV